MDLKGFTTLDEVGGDDFKDEVPPYYDKFPLVQPIIEKHQDLPLVGIQYVLEVRPSQSATLEKCYYICAICSKKMTQTTLIAHIKSVPHRLKFSESHCKDVFAKFGVIDLKTWTAPLVKEFTQALSKVEGNIRRHQLAVALERDMSLVLGALKEKIAKVSQYGKYPEVEEQRIRSAAPINIKMPSMGSASQPKATSVNPVSGTAGDAPDAAISTAKKDNFEVICLDDASTDKEIKPISSNVRKRNYRGPRGESRSRSRSNSPKRRKSRSPTLKSRSPIPRNRKRSRSPTNDSRGGRRRSTSRSRDTRDSRVESPGSRNSRRRPRSRERAKGNPPEKEKRMSSAERAKITEERKLADFRQAEARLIARHKNQQEILARNPESHPYYTREWKKFWGTRYKELEMQGINPNRYDFKREWIPYWNDRMLELGNMDLDRKRKTLLQKFRMEDPGAPVPKPVPGSLPPGPGAGVGNNTTNVNVGNIPGTGVGNIPGAGVLNNPTNVTVDRNMSVEDASAWSGGRSRIDRSPSPWEDDGREPRKEVKNPSPPPQEILQPQNSGGNAFEQEYSVVGTLKILSELEDQLGSFGPAINTLLEKAVEITESGGKAMDLFNDKDNGTLVKLAREKLSHQIISNFLAPVVQARTQMAVERGVWLEKEAEKLTKNEYLGLDIPVIAKASLGLDTVQVAQFIAQSLLNLGKSNVSEDDLQRILLAVAATHAKLMAEHKAAVNLALQLQASTPVGSHTSTPATVGSSTPTAVFEKSVGSVLAPPIDVSHPMVTNSPVVSSATTTVKSALFPSGISEESPKTKKNATNMTTAAADSSTSNGSGGLNNTKSDEEKEKLKGSEDVKDKLKDAGPKDMDKLTLEELMALLSNFSSLKREEQQALTAYLKKLELTDVKKVTKLRGMIQANAKKAKSKVASTVKSVSKPVEPAPVKPVTSSTLQASVTSSGVGISAVSSSKEEVICLEESDPSKNNSGIMPGPIRGMHDNRGSSDIPGSRMVPGDKVEPMRGLGDVPGPMRGPSDVPGSIRGPNEMQGPMRGQSDIEYMGRMGGPDGLNSMGVPREMPFSRDGTKNRDDPFTRGPEGSRGDVDNRVFDIDNRIQYSGNLDRGVLRDGPFTREEPIQKDDPFTRSGPLGQSGPSEWPDRENRGQPAYGERGAGDLGKDQDRFGMHDDNYRMGGAMMRSGSDPRDGPMRGGPDPRDDPMFRGGPDIRDGPLRGAPDPRDGPMMRGGQDPRDDPFMRGGPDPRDDPFMRGGPDPRDGPMRGGPDPRDGPMRGGQDPRDGPMRGGPDPRDEPMMRGGPDLRDGPMRGGPDPSYDPMSMMRGGPMMRDGPMRGGPDPRDDPMFRGGPDLRDGPLRGAPPDSRDGPMMRGGQDPRDDPFMRGGQDPRDDPFMRGGPDPRDGPMRGGPDPRDGPMRGGPDPRDGPMRGGPDPRDGPMRGGPDPMMRGGPDSRSVPGLMDRPIERKEFDDPYQREGGWRGENSFQGSRGRGDRGRGDRGKGDRGRGDRGRGRGERGRGERGRGGRGRGGFGDSFDRQSGHKPWQAPNW